MSAQTLDVSVIGYSKDYAQDLLRLLLLLQRDYFSENASEQIKELRAEKDIEGAYKTYVRYIASRQDDTWKVLLAVASGEIIGFIIGSILVEPDLVNGIVGRIEDWYVDQEYRGSGIGLELYDELEDWFIEKECDQVVSDTWAGNELSIKAHKQSGFFISGISFSKKL